MEEQDGTFPFPSTSGVGRKWKRRRSCRAGGKLYLRCNRYTWRCNRVLVCSPPSEPGGRVLTTPSSTYRERLSPLLLELGGETSSSFIPSFWALFTCHYFFKYTATSPAHNTSCELSWMRGMPSFLTQQVPITLLHAGHRGTMCLLRPKNIEKKKLRMDE